MLLGVQNGGPRSIRPGILGRVSDLEAERDRIDRALAGAGAGWDGWPGVAATAPIDDRARLSALLLLLAIPDPRAEFVEGPVVDLLDPADDVIDRLRRRRLPWDRTTARLALEAVTTRGRFDDRRVAAALRGAEAVCSTGAADVDLIAALETCASWLDGLSPDVWRVVEMRLAVRRALAAAAPPDLLDLSLIGDGDAWGGPAREAARVLVAEEIAPLVRRLGELGPRKPSQTWLRRTAEALRPTGAADLLHRWLELAAYTEVVAPDDTVSFSGGMLFTRGNEEVVRAAVIASRLLPTDRRLPYVLGVLARRGAATSGESGMTASLALKVASAAIDALAARGAAEDRQVLEELLDDLSRRDLVKRVGEALGQQAKATERDEALRREKAAAARRKADPAPRLARAAVDVLIRQHLAPELRRLGFRGSGRIWRRLHEDRVDIVSLGSREHEVRLAYGVRFDASHPDDEPDPVDRATARDTDVSLYEDWPATEPALDRCADRLRSVVVPFLDTFARYELTRAYLEYGAGAPPHALSMNTPGSPVVSGVLGMLAMAAGDRDTAVECLRRRLASAESWAGSSRTGTDDTARGEVSFWRAQLAKARRLA